MLGVVPLFDPPRHDTGDTVRKALELGVNVKMITGDQLAIAKETGRRLGMGTNMYPSTALFGQGVEQLGIDETELIEQGDGFAGKKTLLLGVFKGLQNQCLLDEKYLGEGQLRK